MPASQVQEVEEVDEIEDFSIDEDDYDADLMVSYDEGEDDESGDGPEVVDTSMLTSTENFMNAQPEIVDEIVDLGVVVAEPDQASYVIRVIDDIGPVYYGDELIELKRGRRYRVPPHIYKWCSDKGVLWEQQS